MTVRFICFVSGILPLHTSTQEGLTKQMNKFESLRKHGSGSLDTLLLLFIRSNNFTSRHLDRRQMDFMEDVKFHSYTYMASWAITCPHPCYERWWKGMAKIRVKGAHFAKKKFYKISITVLIFGLTNKQYMHVENVTCFTETEF